MATKPTPESYLDSVPEENRWKLDKKLDFERNDVQIHLGRIAASMIEWEGRVADELGLTESEVADIKEKYCGKLDLQKRAALQKWQEKFGPEATYKNLITAFLNADKGSYAEAVCKQLKPLDKSDKSVRQCDHIEDSSRSTEDAQHEHGDTALKDEPNSQPSCSGATINTPTVSSPKATPQETQFPFLNVDSLSEDQRENLEDQLLSDTRAITLKFAHLQEVVESSLCDRNVLPERLANCVLRIAGVYSDVVSVLKEHEDELKKATSVSKIFLILTDYISFFNYEILDHIVKTLGTENDKSELKQYLTHFQEFCKRSVFEVPPNSFGRACTVTEKRQKLVMKMTGNAKALMTKKHPTLIDIRGAKFRIAHIVGISTSSLYLCRVDEGCVEMLFLVPRCIFKDVRQKLFNQRTIGELSLYGITVCHERTQICEVLPQFTSHVSYDVNVFVSVPGKRLEHSELKPASKRLRPEWLRRWYSTPEESFDFTRHSELAGEVTMDSGLEGVTIPQSAHFFLDGYCIPEGGGFHRSSRSKSGIYRSLNASHESGTEDQLSSQFSRLQISGKPDFRELCEELLQHGVQNDMIELGWLLGMGKETLDYIMEDCPQNYDPVKCLRQLLRRWLRRDDPPLTWSAITKAVNILGYKYLAEHLQQQHVSQSSLPGPHVRKGVTEVKSTERDSDKEDNHSDSGRRPDFRELYKELKCSGIQHEWKKLGSLLRIPHIIMSRWMELESLEGIQSVLLRSYHGDSDRYEFPQIYLRRLLLFWLNRDDPPPSWSAMIEAVDKLGKTKQLLVEKLRKEYLHKI